MKTVLKKILAITLLVGLMLMISGCNDDDEMAIVQGGEPEVAIRIIDGYPSDFMPLYKAVIVNESAYWVREGGYLIGKDIYTLEFESSATKDELSTYYKGLYDEIDKEMSFGEYSLSGFKGSQRINVTINDPLGDRAVGNSVSISFGVPKEDYATTNKYYDLDPADFMDMAFVDHQVDYMYRELYRYDQKQYSTSYITTEDPETIISHYRGLYESSDSYTEDANDYGVTFRWKANAYWCTVRFADSTGVDFISLTLEAPLK